MESGLGKFLQQMRTVRQWSMRGLAASAGISKSAMSDWETGKKQPRLPELEATLEALGASAAQRRHALSLLDAPRAVRLLRQEAEQSALEEGIGPALVGGDLLRAMRLRRRATLSEVAARIGVQASSLSRWERGESWPTTPHLHALCYTLEAHEEELLALTSRKFTLTPRPPKEVLEDMEREISGLAFFSYCPEMEALKDLHYLTLIQQLQSYASCHSSVGVWLLPLYARYAQFLAERQRPREAQSYIERAFDLRKKAYPPPWYWLCAGNVAAQIAVYYSRRPRPTEGVNILRGWLDYLANAPETRPNDRAWALSDMAKYMVMENNAADAAVELAQQAYAITGEIGSNMHDIYCRQCDVAQMLLRAGRAREALEALPSSDRHDMPDLALQETLLEGEVWLALGKPPAASSCLQRSFDLIETHGLQYRRSSAEALAQKLDSLSHPSTVTGSDLCY